MNLDKITKSKHFTRGRSHRLHGMQAPDLEPEIDRLEKIMRHPSFLGPRVTPPPEATAFNDPAASEGKGTLIDLRISLDEPGIECGEASLVMSAVGKVNCSPSIFGEEQTS